MKRRSSHVGSKKVKIDKPYHLGTRPDSSASLARPRLRLVSTMGVDVYQANQTSRTIIHSPQNAAHQPSAALQPGAAPQPNSIPSLECHPSAQYRPLGWVIPTLGQILLRFQIPPLGQMPSFSQVPALTEIPLYVVLQLNATSSTRCCSLPSSD